MIKKSLRAYITGSQLIFLILAHRKVVWLLGFQCIKHQVYGVFELLVILPDFHRIDELKKTPENLDFPGSFALLPSKNLRFSSVTGFAL